MTFVVFTNNKAERRFAFYASFHANGAPAFDWTPDKAAASDLTDKEAERLRKQTKLNNPAAMVRKVRSLEGW